MGNIVVVGDMPESGVALGVDLSDWQNPGAIDWSNSASEGPGWCMVKLSNGGRASVHGGEHMRRARIASESIGGYHFQTEADPQAQVDAFLGQLAQHCQPDDIAPNLDLEWLIENGQPRLPRDPRAYCRSVDLMMDALLSRWGGLWIYSCTGFWQAMGSPSSWLGVEWWVPWYPSPGFSEADARAHAWPKRPGVETPAAWQFGCPRASWAGNGPIDRNIARRLPMVVER